MHTWMCVSGAYVLPQSFNQQVVFDISWENTHLMTFFASLDVRENLTSQNNFKN